MTKKYKISAKMDEKNYGKAKKLPQYIAALSVCLGSVAAGTVLGWTGNISDRLENSELNDIPVGETEKGWIGSFTTLGAMLMCFPIGFICDKIGRKPAMLLTIIPFIVGWILIIFSKNIGMIYAGRFITGLAGGAFCVSAPMYTSEIAEDEIRGTLGSFFQLLLTVGILFSYILGGYIPNPKVFSIICAIVPLVFGLVFFFQPETPVYLLKKNKPDEALKSLTRMRGTEYDVNKELEDIKKSLDNQKSAEQPFFEAIKDVAAKKALFICFSLMFFQQFSGVNAFVFYTSTIFKESGSSIDIKVATVIVGVSQVAATFVSSLVVDKFGRKVLLIASGFFMALSGVVLGIYMSLKKGAISEETAKDIGWLPITCVIVFFAVFSLGFGPIPWMASSELMPPSIKSTASSAAATFNWLLAFIVTKFYGDLSHSIGGDSTFYIFAGFSLAGALFVYFIMPETKGKSMEQVQAELKGQRLSSEGVDNKAYVS